MSLAWTTIVLLIYLLPGFLFLLGINLSRRAIKQQETSPNAIAFLAGAILPSFFVHAFLVTVLNHGVSIPQIPEVDFKTLLATFHLGAIGDGGSIALSNLSVVSENINSNFGWIIAYVLLSSILGLLIGFSVYGPYIKRYGTRIEVELARAKREGGIIFAHVLTTLCHDNHHVLYRGHYKDISLGPGGQILYLILDNVERCYLILESTGIASSSLTHPLQEEDHFYIDGDDIRNIVLSRSIEPSYQFSKAFLDELRRLAESSSTS